jgi:hypothetical protein
MEDLFTLHQLCPNIDILLIECSDGFNGFDIISKFKEVETIYFFGFCNKLAPFTDFLKNLKENKIKKIIFPQFSQYDKTETLEFHKILFEKTNLEEFEGLNLSFTEEELNIVSPWIEKNHFLKEISFGCKYFII